MPSLTAVVGAATAGLATPPPSAPGSPAGPPGARSSGSPQPGARSLLAGVLDGRAGR
jgi:hypothetical protein